MQSKSWDSMEIIILSMAVFAAGFLLSQFLQWYARKRTFHKEKLNTQNIDNLDLLRTILDAVPTTISAKGRDLRYIFVNQYQADWLYGVPADDVVGKTAGELVGQEYGEYTSKNDQYIIDTGKSLINYEEEIVDAKGHVHTVLTTKVPLLNDQKEVVAIVTAALDISDRKIAEIRLLNSEDKAIRANRAKSDFLASMSHELRTPLNAILGFSESCLLNIFGPLGHSKYDEYAELINKSGLQLLSLINDILDLSKIESSEYQLDDQPHDLGALNEEILKIFSIDMTGRNIKINNMSDAIRGTILEVDERCLTQIMNNLISNATKFSKKDGVVEVIWAINEQSECVLEIRDHGSGIPSDEIKHLTRAFFQVNAQISRDESGTGLGLYICKKLVELHGGSLTIQSEENVGTSVFVTFPASRVSSKNS